MGSSNLEYHLFLNTEVERRFLAESCPGEKADRKQKGTAALAAFSLLLRARGTGPTAAGHKPNPCTQRQGKEQHTRLHSPSRALSLGKSAEGSLLPSPGGRTGAVSRARGRERASQGKGH